MFCDMVKSLNSFCVETQNDIKSNNVIFSVALWLVLSYLMSAFVVVFFVSV